MDSNALSLKELGTLIRRVVALNFQESLWVKGEIAHFNEVRGIAYLELVEKEEGQSDQIVARQSAVIWQRNFQQLKARYPDDLASFLEPGREILVQAQVEFTPRYGLKLIIEDIDPAYTMGRLYQQRRAMEEVIMQEKLNEPNKNLVLAPVIRHIAVLSNEQAAGYQDFIHQLRENAQRYTFQIHLFPISLQGGLVEETVLGQIATLSASYQKMDLAVILRGGGSRLDLAGFDSLLICRAIAHLPLKLATGIGHETDETLADLVAGISLKTPTAVAEFILQHNESFENRMRQAVERIRESAWSKVQRANIDLQKCRNELSVKPLRRVSRAAARLEGIQGQIPTLVRNRLRLEEVKLQQFERIIQLSSIAGTLRRGFSITLSHPEGKPLTGTPIKGQDLETIWKDGKILSRVTESSSKSLS